MASKVFVFNFPQKDYEFTNLTFQSLQCGIIFLCRMYGVKTDLNNVYHSVFHAIYKVRTTFCVFEIR